MVEKEKSLFDYKIGEIINKDLGAGLLKKPVKLVRIGYIYQSEDGVQMECVLKHKDLIEDKKEKTFICDECHSETTEVYESINNPDKRICESCSDEECEEGGE